VSQLGQRGVDPRKHAWSRPMRLNIRWFSHGLLCPQARARRKAEAGGPSCSCGSSLDFSPMLALPVPAGQSANGRYGEKAGRTARPRSRTAKRLAVGGAPGFTADAANAQQ
jgi:hypothetical protein